MADNDFNSDGFPKDFSPRDFSETPRDSSDSSESATADSNRETENTVVGSDRSGNLDGFESHTTSSPVRESLDSVNAKSSPQTDAEPSTHTGEHSGFHGARPRQPEAPAHTENQSYGSAYEGNAAEQFRGRDTAHNGPTRSYDPRLGVPQHSEPQAGYQSGGATEVPQQRLGQFAQPTFSQGEFLNQGFESFGQPYIEKHEGNFFQSLLDFKFKRFITVKHAPVIFRTLVAFGVFVCILMLVGELDKLDSADALGYYTYDSAEEEVITKFLLVGVFALGLLSYVLFIRVLLEWAISAVRTSDAIARLQGNSQE